MTTTPKQATAEVLDYLEAMQQERVRPAEARRRFRAVKAQHPELRMELVWEEESYDGSVHYDALLRAPDGETVSVSFSQGGALPWPLRGVRRWSDADLAQVNGKILKIQDAVGLLDALWSEAPIVRQLLDVCLIREELEQHPIELSDAEVQRGMDRLRRAHKLHDAAATHRWLHERGMTHERLELAVTDDLTIDKLRERVAADRVERYFDAHRSGFDTAQVAQMEFADEPSARRTYGDLVSGEIDLFEAAARQFLAGSKSKRPLFATLRRRDLSDEVGAAIFAAAPGSVSVLRAEDRHLVTRVLSLIPARLDEPTRAVIKELLFEEWLAERRQTADVTWFWGTADRAAVCGAGCEPER